MLDFGGRSSRIERAHQQLLSANLAFNRVLLDVSFETGSGPETVVFGDSDCFCLH